MNPLTQLKKILHTVTSLHPSSGWTPPQGQDTFIESAKIILQKLTIRKYPIHLHHEALDKVSKMDRQQLLRQSTKKKSNKIRLITH